MSGTSEAVFEYLDSISKSKKPIPPLRSIRQVVGGGSMSTISKAVMEWKASKGLLSEDEFFPEELSDEDRLHLTRGVWKIFRPLLTAKLRQREKKFREQLEQNQTELSRLRAENSALKEQKIILQHETVRLAHELEEKKIEVEAANRTLKTLQEMLGDRLRKET